MNNSDSRFPDDFTWGVATSAFQIEGAVEQGGRGPSVWDAFCAIPGKVRGGDSGQIACDHCRRYSDDVRILAGLEVPAYRFSISWPRILPAGQGIINHEGLDFYDSLVDELLAHSIEPWVTLFHWDYPQKLQDEGGWLSPESPRWFADYVRIVVRRLSDRVRNWITINEPQCFIRFGHGETVNAPGLALPVADCLLAVHHVLLAHGQAVEVIRANSEIPARVGWAPVGVAAVPASLSPANIEAATMAMAEVPANLWSNVWFSDPVFFGKYPQEAEREFESAMPNYTAEQMRSIAQPLDFLGLNIYTGTVVEADGMGGYRTLPHPTWGMRTAFDWPVLPESLYWGLRFHSERYRSPIYITENGMANIDWVSLDGCVHDPQRVDYLKRHLFQTHQAIVDGIDVRGYFLWSLLDNFEWAEGFSKRFGLVHVDFATQQRTLKDSANWYRDVIRTNGGMLRL